MTTLHVVVTGRVQGVGFRWYVREQARALGLRGWVRNNADGSVEVLASGAEGELDRLRSILRTGPSGARVSAVDVSSVPPPAPAMDPFGILR